MNVYIPKHVVLELCASTWKVDSDANALMGLMVMRGLSDAVIWMNALDHHAVEVQCVGTVKEVSSVCAQKVLSVIQ